MVRYLIEVNTGLTLVMLVYGMFLKNENHFSFKRAWLMAGITFSLLVPLLTFPLAAGPRLVEGLNEWMPTYMMQDVESINTIPSAPVSARFDLWLLVIWVYWVVTGLLAGLFVLRLAKMMYLFSSTARYAWKNCWVVESPRNIPAFSFFRNIFIGQAHLLTPAEKEIVRMHEWVHVTKWHSLDMVLVNLLDIFFWINPLVILYKKAFIQLHEFEADARSVEMTEVDEYCGLLARVALHSAGFPVVSHFSYSLTLKRIEMMKKMKKKMNYWKFIPLASSLLLLVLIVSCQEHVMVDLKEMNKNSSTAIVYPQAVQNQIELLRQQNPGNEYRVVYMNQSGKLIMEKLLKENPLITAATLVKVKADDSETYLIISQGKNGKSNMLQGLSSWISADSIYSVTEQQPLFPGGMDSLIAFVKNRTVYPAESRNAGIEGRVFVAFVVTKEGDIVNPTIVKGVAPQLDKAAIELVSQFPRWIPGQQDGKPVNARFVMPINFKR